MKNTILTTALAGFGMALLPLHAADNATEKTAPAKEAQVAKTISTYIIHYSGKG